MECEDLECILIQIRSKGEKDFLLGYIYRPPSSNADWFNLFEELLENTAGTGLNLVIMGDLNVDILHTKNHNHTIRHLIQAFNLTQLVELPTRVTENSSTSIDHVYATNPDYVQEIQIPKIGLSDHYPTSIY